MGIVDIVISWSGDECDQESPDAKNFSLAARQTATVTVDNGGRNDTSLTVAAALLEPRLRQQYALDFFLKCSRISVKRLSPILFEISAIWDTHARIDQSPLDLPLDIEYDSIVTEEETDQDADGNWMATVNGERFDPPVRVPVYDMVVRASKNLATYDDSWAQQFRNRVNETDWGPYPAGTVRVVSLKGQSVLDDDFQYWRVRGEFQIRDAPPSNGAFILSDDGKTWEEADDMTPLSWYRRILAAGFYGKDSDGSNGLTPGLMGKARNPLTGEEFTIPSLHNPVTGYFRPRDSTTGLQDPTKACWYFFKVFKTADLNEIGFFD